MCALPSNWKVYKQTNTKYNRPYYYDTQRKVKQWLRPFPPPGYDGPWPLLLHCAHILIKHQGVRNPKTHNKMKRGKSMDRITREAALSQIKNLLKKILKGDETFEQVAKKESDCSSYDRSGDLQWHSTDTLHPDFVKHARLLQINTISEPFESPSGWHIVKRLDGEIGQPNGLMTPAPPPELDMFVPEKKEYTEKVKIKIKERAQELYNLIFLIEQTPKELANWKKLLEIYSSVVPEFTTFHEIYIKGILYFFPGDYEALTFVCKILNMYKTTKEFKINLLETTLIYTWNPKFWKLYEKEVLHNASIEERAKFTKRMMENVGFTVNTAQYWDTYISLLQSLPESEQNNALILSEIRKSLDIGLENASLLLKKLNEIDPSSVQYYTARQDKLKAIVERRKKMINNINLNDESSMIKENPEQKEKMTEEEHFKLWRTFIDSELKNDAEYTEDLYIQCMDYNYRLFLSAYWWMPSIWMEYWHFLIKYKQGDKANKILAIGRKAVGDTPLFELRRAQHFIDFEQYEEAREIYLKIIKNSDQEALKTSALTLLFKATADLKSEQDAVEVIHQFMEISKPEFFINAAKFCTDTNIAWNIYQMGVDRFPRDNKMIIAAAEFLEDHRDIRNTRLLFQQSLAERKENLQFSIKKRLFKFELDHIAPLDHLNETQKVFQNTNIDPSILYMHRFKFRDLYPLDPEELKVWGHLAKNGSLDLVEDSNDSAYLSDTVPYGYDKSVIQKDEKWIDFINTNIRKATASENTAQKKIPREIHHLLKEIEEIAIYNALDVNLVMRKIQTCEIRDYRQGPF